MEKVNSKEIKLMSDNIAVKPLSEADEVTPGGIVVPKNQFKPIRTGEVIAVGPGRRARNGNIIPVTLSPGDQVLYHMNDGESANKSIKIDGNVCFIIPERNLLCGWD